MFPIGCCFVCKKPAWKKCSECAASRDNQHLCRYFCDSCCSRVHSACSDVPGSTDIHCNKEVADGRSSLHHLQLLSVICIETSHYVCFTRSIAQNQWIFFDSMADRVCKYISYWYHFHEFCNALLCTNLSMQTIYTTFPRELTALKS